MKRIILTDRDNQIIEFLETYKIANTSTIANIFFNGSKRPCSRRLKHLKEHGFINSTQEFVCLEMVYYIGRKPTQIKHSTIVSSFIGKLCEYNIEILKTKVEFKIDNIRSDLLLVCKIDGEIKIFFIEVCNTKKFDLNKYIKLKNNNRWKEYFPFFPSIVVISNKPFENHKELNIIGVNLDLNNFDNIKG